MPLVTNANAPLALSAPGIDGSNYPPQFLQTSTNTNPAIPAPPPSGSETVQPIHPDQLPPDTHLQLQQRLQEKAGN